MDEVFNAILFEGDWQGEVYKDALAGYIQINTGFDRGIIDNYLSCVSSYDVYEFESLSQGMDISLMNLTAYIKENTSLSVNEINILSRAEDEFYRILNDSYSRLDQILAA